MFRKVVSAEGAARILDAPDVSVFDEIVARHELKPAKTAPEGPLFVMADVIALRLAQVMSDLGVESAKALRYADAVLGERLRDHDENVVDWIENEAQELFCLIADGQLARIFLRNKEDFKEFDVGAVKPILFPTTRCEINVFRVIRPVVYRARQMHALS